MMRDLGEYLQNVRVKSGVTQRMISDALGFSSPQYVSNVERGLCKPSPNHLGVWTEMIGANKNTVFQYMMSDYKKKVREGLGL